MNNSYYRVNLSIGKQMSLEFDALGEVKTSGLTFTEVDNHGNLMPEKGMLVTDGKLNRIAVSYLGFRMVMDIMKQTEADNGGHLFVCVTDFLRVDITVTNIPVGEGESISF